MKDAGNTSAKKNIKQVLIQQEATTTQVEPIEGRSIKATLNHHPVEANINKAN